MRIYQLAIAGLHSDSRRCGREHRRDRAAARRRARSEHAAPPSGARVRVLIVDDQALVRAGFRMILEAEPDLEVVGEAADGVEAVDEARAARSRTSC